ncbi:hypothetical protein EDD99_5473 [Streptomyces sp. 846.5]|nr:hypothetical protein [Streptomyces sp. 846.5]TDT97347.1 hypothetical protein EDD99_5473 [Streptomyces sp. 846.5]
MPLRVLPHLPGLPAPFLAAPLYAVAGLAYLAVFGANLPDRLRPTTDSTSPLRRAAGLTLLVLMLWPAAPLFHAARSKLAHRIAAALRSLIRTVLPRTTTALPQERLVRMAARPVTGRTGEPAHLGAGATFASAAVRLRSACEQQRLVDAVFIASALVNDTTLRRGPDHPQALDAMELLAHVAHLVGDHARAARLYIHVADHRAWHFGIDHPGARSALRNAYASWLSAPDQARAAHLIRAAAVPAHGR